jgi:hypothetical protein
MKTNTAYQRARRAAETEEQREARNAARRAEYAARVAEPDGKLVPRTVSLTPAQWARALKRGGGVSYSAGLRRMLG